MHNKSDIKEFFRSLPASSRLERKKAYEHLMAVENDQVRGIKMPWMVPAWKHGQAMLNEVIEEENAKIVAQNAKIVAQNAK